MQKLTNEEIARVFAMYIGQDYTALDEPVMKVTWKTLYYLVKHKVPKVKRLLCLTPLSKISDEDAIEVAKIVCNKQFIEPTLINAQWQPTIKEEHHIFSIQFEAYQVTKHLGDKPQNLLLYINSWGTINLYVNHELANNALDCFIWQYLISKGYAVPLFFAPNHWANGKTAIELGIAICSSKTKR